MASTGIVSSAHHSEEGPQALATRLQAVCTQLVRIQANDYFDQGRRGVDPVEGTARHITVGRIRHAHRLIVVYRHRDWTSLLEEVAYSVDPREMQEHRLHTRWKRRTIQAFCRAGGLPGLFTSQHTIHLSSPTRLPLCLPLVLHRATWAPVLPQDTRDCAKAARGAPIAEVFRSFRSRSGLVPVSFCSFRATSGLVPPAHRARLLCSLLYDVVSQSPPRQHVALPTREGETA
jgi:hypothetical protein